MHHNVPPSGNVEQKVMTLRRKGRMKDEKFEGNNRRLELKEGKKTK